MDQAITRAVGATPSTMPPAAAPRLVGEFQGYVDGIVPSVRWFDRKNMPQVGDRLFAIPAHAAAARAWSILLTSPNHGTVGPLGSTFPHAGEHHERVVVVEVPAGAGAPSDEVNLVLRAAPAAEAGVCALLTDEQAAFERHERGSNLRRVGVDRDGSGGWYENPCVQSAWEGWRARAEVAAQAGQVAVPGWTSVDDRYPEFTSQDRYLVASNWGVTVAHLHDPQWARNCFQDCVTKNDEGMTDFDGYQEGVFKVTHWMPLPAAPSPAKESK